MNYCVYNREFDQFLYLFYSHDEMGEPICKAEWDDEFVYALADSDEKIPVETVWPEDTIHNNYFLFVCRRIDEMDIGMKDVRFVSITNGVPDFEREYFLI